MFNTMKRLWDKTKDATVIANAVKKGYITPEQYELIVGEKYSA